MAPSCMAPSCVLLPTLDVQDEDGWAAAMKAALRGHPHCLTALIDNKANLDIQVRE